MKHCTHHQNIFRWPRIIPSPWSAALIIGTLNSTNFLEKIHLTSVHINMHSLSQQSYTGSMKNHLNKSDTFVTSEEHLIYFNYIEIHSHEKRDLKKKTPERIINKAKNDRQTMAAAPHLRQCSVWVWDWFCSLSEERGTELFPRE